MSMVRRIASAAPGLLLPLALWTCKGEDNSPDPSPLLLEKTPSKSGDGQTAPAGTQLPSELRVVITRDGEPVEHVSVDWDTPDGGEMEPTVAETDLDGVAVADWTLGPDNGDQTASATVKGATGSPLIFTATARAPAP